MAVARRANEENVRCGQAMDVRDQTGHHHEERRLTGRPGMLISLHLMLCLLPSFISSFGLVRPPTAYGEQTTPSGSHFQPPRPSRLLTLAPRRLLERPRRPPPQSLPYAPGWTHGIQRQGQGQNPSFLVSHQCERCEQLAWAAGWDAWHAESLGPSASGLLEPSFLLLVAVSPHSFFSYLLLEAPATLSRPES